MANKSVERGFHSIIYYRRWAKMLRPLPDELRWAISDAILDYLIDGALPTDPVILYSSFASIRSEIDDDKEKYAETCEKRAEAGRKGASVRYGK